MSTKRLTPEKIEAIQQYYKENANTPRQDMKLKEAAQRIGVGTTTMRNYGNKAGLLNPNRKQSAISHNYKEERYRVDPETGCWVWLLFKTEGYGQDGPKGKRNVAHRISYEKLKGPIPKGAYLDHLCRNRACVNPDHLEPVTQAENIRRSPFCKLSKDDVVSIRRTVAEGTANQTEVAAQYGVDPSLVCRIMSFQRWPEGKEQL